VLTTGVVKMVRCMRRVSGTTPDARRAGYHRRHIF